MEPKDRQGLYQKYKLNLVRIDGTEISDDAFYFILMPETDMHARYALKAYADSVQQFNRKLSDDINAWLKSFGWSRVERHRYFSAMRVAMYAGLSLGIVMGGTTMFILYWVLKTLNVLP